MKKKKKKKTSDSESAMKLFSSNPSLAEIQALPGYASCDCFRPLSDSNMKWAELEFHSNETPREVAFQLEQLIQLTAEQGIEVFCPRKDLGGALWAQVTRLPPSISHMTQVRRMDLYGSRLEAIPREIMFMTNLIDFDPYTSYRLHWFPFELARCPALKTSRISTRALYGNHNYRPPFPRLPKSSADTGVCSVCDAPTSPGTAIQRWISVRVATDVVPLLVNACSGACLASLPAAAEGSIPRPHKGGVSSRPPVSKYSYR